LLDERGASMVAMSLGSTLSVPQLLCFCFLALVSSSSSMANSDFDFVKNVGLREYERRIGIFVIWVMKNCGK